MRPCFKFTAAATAGQAATLSIYDEIGGWGVQAKDFIKELAGIDAKTLNVEINSPGGDVFAGLAMYNALRNSGKEIVVKVMGVAASAASLIAMAGDKIVMPKNTFMMVHNPWGVAVGNASEMRDTADVLDKIGQALQATYVAKTGLPEDEVAALLAVDTWLTADEALAKGFATEVTDDIKANAAFDMERADLPAAVKAIYAAAKEPPVAPLPEPDDLPADDDLGDTFDSQLVEQIVASASDAGLREHALFFAASANTKDEADALIARAKSISFLCKHAEMPERTSAAIRSDKTLRQVGAELVEAQAKADVHIDASKKLNQQDAPRASSGVSTKSVWNSHEKMTKQTYRKKD